MPQAGEFALDPAVAPLGVLCGEAEYELLEGGRGGWSAGAAAARGVVTLLGDEPAVPGEERAGGDGEDRGPSVAGDQRGEGCQPESVGLFVADRAFELAAQDGVLVPRDQQFGVLAVSRRSGTAGMDSSVRAAR